MIEDKRIEIMWDFIKIQGLEKEYVLFESAVKEDY